MAMGTLKKRILDDRYLTLEVELPNVRALDEPVGRGAYDLKIIDARLPRLERTLFGRSFRMSAQLNTPVSVRVRADGEAIAELPELGPISAHSGTRYAEFNLVLDVDLGGSGSVPVSGAGLTIGVSVGGEADGRYRHFLPVKSDATLRGAVGEVLGRSVLPQLLAPSRHPLADGEMHVVTAGCHLDLGLRARLGNEFEHWGILRAFGQASDRLRAKIAYSIEASLGYTLDRRMSLLVGRINTMQEGWVRVRLATSRKEQLGFAVVFQLTAEYDLGSGLLSLLDAALELDPVRRLRDAMSSLAEVAAALEAPGATWNQLKRRLSSEAAELIGDFVDDHNWLDWVETSPTLAELLTHSRQLVAAYRGLDERITALWDQVLGSSRLGEGERFEKLLRKVAGLDPQNPEAILDEQWRDAITLIEWLSGSSVEELLFGSQLEAQRKLSGARDVARRAVDLMANAPEALLQKVNAFAERTGIEAVVEWLERSTGSPADFKKALQGTVSQQVQRAVGALLDRAWDAASLDESDRGRLKKLAVSLRELLDGTSRWEERLRAELLALKGSVGFSLSMEMERLAQDTALIDLEIDARNEACWSAFSEELSRGRITEFLGRLAAIDPREIPDGSESALPYLLRDCALTSRRVRSSSLSVLFSLLGVRIDRSQRLVESTVRSLQRGGVTWREGRYSAALVSARVDDKMTATAAVWLELAGAGAGLALDGPYDQSFHAWLRFAYTRNDDILTSEELRGLSEMLGQLGFVSTGGQVPVGRQVHFGLEYQVPATSGAVDALLSGLSGSKGEAQWNHDLLNAAHRWFDDRLVSIRDPALKGRYPDQTAPLARYVLPLFIQSSAFKTHWLEGPLGFEGYARRKWFKLTDGGVELSFSLMPEGDWVPPYLCLKSLIAKRGPGLKRFRRLARRYGQLATSPGHDLAMAFIGDFGAALKAASPRFWPSPLSAVWLVLARLASTDPAVFSGAEGVATCRWSEEGRPANPVVWRVDTHCGLADERFRRAVFPIPEKGGE